MPLLLEVRWMTSLVVRKEIHGGIEVVKLERVRVICPACEQKVEAVASDGRVRGYCAIAKQLVDFLIETQPVPIGKHPTDETKAEISVGPMPGRDSRGRFVKGNVPHNKKVTTTTIFCSLSSSLRIRLCPA
jgi:endogenous inhibitor of DNA gyrase (YacG/DUF329 family)